MSPIFETDFVPTSLDTGDAEVCLCVDLGSTETNVFAKLSPGDVVQFKPRNAKEHPDTYGLSTLPALILKTLTPTYILVIPLTSTPQRSSYFPPLVVNSHPYYAAIPRFRAVKISHLDSYRIVGRLSAFAYSRLRENICSFLAL